MQIQVFVLTPLYLWPGVFYLLETKVHCILRIYGTLHSSLALVRLCEAIIDDHLAEDTF